MRLDGDVLIVEVAIEYLRERISDDGNRILMELHGFRSIKYTPWKEEPIACVADIAIRELDIDNAGVEQDSIVVVVSDSNSKWNGGELNIHYSHATLRLDSGRVLPYGELESVATAYWAELEKEWQNNKERKQTD